MTSGYMPLYLIQMNMPLREPLPSPTLWKWTVICYINSYELLLNIQRTHGMCATKRCILEPALLVLSKLVWCWALIPKWNHNVYTLKNHTVPSSPAPAMPALQLREESDPKAKTLLFRLLHVGEQSDSCHLVSPYGHGAWNRAACQYATWGLSFFADMTTDFFFFFMCLVFSSGQVWPKGKNSLQLIQVIMHGREKTESFPGCLTDCHKLSSNMCRKSGARVFTGGLQPGKPWMGLPFSRTTLWFGALLPTHTHGRNWTCHL